MEQLLARHGPGAKESDKPQRETADEKSDDGSEDTEAKSAAFPRGNPQFPRGYREELHFVKKVPEEAAGSDTESAAVAGSRSNPMK
jgi:hypothetical protein